MLKSRKKIAPMIIAFPYNQVNIIDYNRVIKTNLEFDEIKKIISKNFSINVSKKNCKLRQSQIEMYLNKKWYLLKLYKKSSELDVTILRNLILNKILKNKKTLNLYQVLKVKEL